MRDVGFVRDDLLGSQRDRAAFSVGSASASSMELVCRHWVPPRTPASASIAVRTMLTSGCSAVRETPAVWVCEAELHRLVELRAVAVFHPACPDPAVRRSSAISSKKSMWALKKKLRRRHEGVDRQAGLEGEFDVGEPVGRG